MRLSRLFASFVVITFANVVSAAPPAKTPPSAAPVSAEATELARTLATKEMWTQGVEQLSSNVQRQLEGHPGSKLKYPKDLPARVRTEVQGALPYDELVALHARELSANYTTPELKELLAFYRTPTGKKWLKVQPQAYEDVAVATQKRMEQKLPEIMNKLGKLAEKPAGAGAKGAETKKSH